MKNILQEYIPFEHANLDWVNGLIAFSRQQKTTNTPEGVIASAVIYANLVEYLVKHLLTNVSHMIYLNSYFQFQGVMFRNSKNEKLNSKTLGQLKNELNNYEFPDKIEFVRLLEKFISARNSLLHKLMSKATKEEVDNVDKDIVDIQNNAEELLQKYNVITAGLQGVWQRIISTPLLESKKSNKQQ